MTNIAQKCANEHCQQTKTSSFRRGLCSTHYYEWLERNSHITQKERTTARPAIIKGDTAKIPLGINAKDGYALVDADMAWLADRYKWTLDGSGYASTGRKRMQFFVMDKPPLGMQIDHINRVRVDNRKTNLRHVTQSQNIANAKGQPNLSGYKGVAYSKSTKNKWRAYYCPFDRKQVNIGYYDTKEEAAKAYDKAAKERWGEFAYQNFPTS